MAPRSFLFASDEELGKKDDDHKLGQRKRLFVLSRHWKSWRTKRVVAVVSIAIFFYFLFKNMPEGLGEMNKRIQSPRGPRREQGLDLGLHPDHSDPMKPPEDLDHTNGAPSQVYDGPIKFYNLAASLHGISRTMGHRDHNHNVLFAASDLKSAAAIIPVACEMSRWKRNYVHITIMGRDDLALEEIQEINNAKTDVCNVYWHDARPDYAAYSSDKRMESSVAGALSHIHNFMHPQAIITADSGHEDDFFTRGIRHKAKELDQTLISIPEDDTISLSWLTRLESRALNAWHTATIDIIVQAPLESAGSLIRLLKSLEAADYAGFLPPRLTIELPHKIDDATREFLGRFEWPPERYLSHYSHGQNNQLILRRRIEEKRTDPDEASIRFVESFYPPNAKGSHALVLSPQTELSPVFFHYLKYHLLEYRYSNYALRDSNKIIGISLETPSLYLNGTTEFVPPEAPTSDSTKGKAKQEEEARLRSFLWQAPNPNAALYFSDDWMEIHSFLSKRQSATVHPSTRNHHQIRQKLISEKSPAWTEYFLDLMRVRGYYLHYPNLFASHGSASTRPSESLVIVHNDLYKAPEEFTRDNKAKEENKEDDQPPEDETVLTAETTYLSSHHPPKSRPNALNIERPLLQSLITLLPSAPLVVKGSPSTDFVLTGPPKPPVPALSSLPLLNYRGESLSEEELEREAANTTIEYRREAGGCPEELTARDELPIHGYADDLFCLWDFDSLPTANPASDNPDKKADDDEGSEKPKQDVETAEASPAEKITTPDERDDGDARESNSPPGEMHPPPDASKSEDVQDVKQDGKAKDIEAAAGKLREHHLAGFRKLRQLDKELQELADVDVPADTKQKPIGDRTDDTSDEDPHPPDWKPIKKTPSGEKDTETLLEEQEKGDAEKHRDIADPENKDSQNQGNKEGKWAFDRERETARREEDQFKNAGAKVEEPKWAASSNHNDPQEEGPQRPPLPKPEADDEQDERVVAERVRGQHVTKAAEGEAQEQEKEINEELKREIKRR